MAPDMLFRTFQQYSCNYKLFSPIRARFIFPNVETVATEKISTYTALYARTGLNDDDEFVIASSHGVALSDVILAQMIYDKAKELGVGEYLPLLREGDIIR